jgi:hypothetical protein
MHKWAGRREGADPRSAEDALQTLLGFEGDNDMSKQFVIPRSAWHAMATWQLGDCGILVVRHLHMLRTGQFK